MHRSRRRLILGRWGFFASRPCEVDLGRECQGDVFWPETVTGFEGGLGVLWKPFKKVGVPLRQGLAWGYQEDTQVSFSYEPDGQDRRTETWKIHNRLL